MSLSLYRKWRPQNFSDVIGQDHVITTLQHALLRNMISHAYLFTGPRGVGKTTTARLLAKSVNCQNPIKKKLFDPCNSCDICKAFNSESMIDVIEVDAASNRGIDDIRALRDKINLAPVLGKYKVYIIDEVHMLTKEAFNALLKTLEEPPPHVILILATTDVVKVPDTILSRCQRFDFRLIPDNVLSAYLLGIAKEEGVDLNEEAAQILTIAASGSGRDALSLLQQVSTGGGKIDAKVVNDLLGFIPSKQIAELLETCAKKANRDNLDLIKSLFSRGYDPENCVRSVLYHLSEALKNEVKESVWSKDLSPERLLAAAEEWAWALRQLKNHPEPYLVIAAAQISCRELWQAKTVAKVADIEKKSIPQAPVVEQTVPKEENHLPQSIAVQTWNPGEDEKVLWQKFVEAAKPHNHSLAALLRDASLLNIQPASEGDIAAVTIGVRFPFHKGRLTEIKNRQTLEDILEEITGQPYKLQCTLIPNQAKSEDPVMNDGELLNAAKELFASGGEK